MPLQSGSRIGVYEIVSPIGAGGMGEVYKARDSRLNRDVAIKVLLDSVVADAERIARFAREAHVLAALNHQNIAHIYGFEESGGTSALVMELVEGPTLADRLKGGPIPVDEALAIARQILDALEVAHGQGIVHRDLKPANIKVRDDGAVKVLDFGLAKAIEASDSSPHAEAANSPTITSPMTMRGVILGTAAYMSPEQAKGKPVDRRADMWSFGCVFFEMLTSRRAFDGEDVTETIAAVITRSPDWNALPAATAPSIRALLEKCCDKNSSRRVPDASVARWLLDQSATDRLSPPRHSRWPMTLASAIVVAALLVGGYWLGHRAVGAESVSEPLRRLSVNLGADVSLLPVTNVGGVNRGVGSSLAFTPDGQHLIFAGRDGSPTGVSRLYRRSLSELAAQPIPGTEGATSPFVSPGGDWIAFFADGKLKKVPTGGGTPVTLCDVAAGRGGAWTDDDVIVFTPSPQPGSSLMRVSASGGTPELLTQLAAGEAVHRWPHALPNRAGILFTISSSNTGPYDSAALAVVPVSGGTPRVVLKGGSSGRYVNSGHLLYVNSGTLFAVGFDLATLSTIGDPVPVVEQVSYAADNGAAQVAVSDAGTLAYVVGSVSSVERTLSWIDRSGAAHPLGSRAFIWNSMRFSPDGRTLVISAGLFQPSNSSNELWLLDWQRDAFKRLTFAGSGDNLYAEWAPDGKSVLFVSNRAADHVRNIYSQFSDGSGTATQLTSSTDSKGRLSVHPSGKFIAFLNAKLETAGDIFVMPVESTASGLKAASAPFPFVNTRANEDSPVFSHDGRWLAYTSDETGRVEVYVQPFPGPGGKWQVSSNGGSSPQWSHSQPELVFQAPDRNLMVSSYTVSGTAFNADKPKPWADRPIFVSSRGFALHPDGKRIAVETLLGTQNPQIREVTLVTTFLKELERLAQPKR